MLVLARPRYSVGMMAAAALVAAVAPWVAGAPSLPPSQLSGLNINVSAISASGISSGADFVVQFHGGCLFIGLPGPSLSAECA